MKHGKQKHDYICHYINQFANGQTMKEMFAIVNPIIVMEKYEHRGKWYDRKKEIQIPYTTFEYAVKNLKANKQINVVFEKSEKSKGNKPVLIFKPLNKTENAS